MMQTLARHLAGQVICTGIPGPYLDETTRSHLEELGPTGIILFKRNIENLAQLQELTRALHALPSAPLVGIDHEGGRVMRLAEPFTHFPSAASIARTGRPELASAVGEAMGRELASVGIDISFSPVLDVNSNPNNPVIGDRAFGDAPEAVSTFALATMEGLRRGGVVPCGKHFPGHGDTDRDSHYELPTVRRSRSEIEAIELLPFRKAIAAGIPLLMTAHVVYPAFDADQPATLSRRIVNDLLRAAMGFRGVIVTDDLQMRALGSDGSVPDSALCALQAGVDWLLIGNALDQSLAAARRIRHALETGVLPMAALQRSAARVRSIPHAHPQAAIALPVAAHARLNADLRATTGTVLT